MTTSSRTPIPIPPAQRLRVWRQRVIPWATFFCGVAVAALIWERAVAPASLVAEVELVQADLRSLQGGRITALSVDLLQPVKAGQVLGFIQPVEPAVLERSLEAIRAEIEYLRASMEPAQGAQRVALDAGRLQLEWMRERVTLASLREQAAEAAENQLRIEKLYAQKIASEESLLAARHLRAGLDAQVSAQAQLVEQMQPAVRAPELALAESPERAAETALAAAIRVQEAQLRLTEAELGPVPLRAPFDGVVSQLYRRSGETLAAGESVLALAATQPVRLIGFIRQPAALAPRAGMRVELRTRARQRFLAESTIEAVGDVWETIPPSLLAAAARPPDSVEKGVRVHIAVPPDLPVRPGEWIDVILLKDRS